MDAFESELLEVLIVQGELTGVVREQIPLDAIGNDAAREIYSTFLHLHSSGQQPDYTKVITELENPSAKSLLERMADSSEAKAGKAQQTPTERLESLITKHKERENVKKSRPARAALEERRFEGQEEIDTLNQLIEQDRMRHGISAPTDG